MDQVHVIRHKVFKEDQSVRRVAREMGLSRNTVRKYLTLSEPKRKENKRRRKPVMEQVIPRIDELIEQWKHQTEKKQRITGSRLYQQLREEGYEVGVTSVRLYLAEKRRKEAEVYIPLVHRPGDEVQVDFFEVHVEEKGVRRKVWKFVMRWMYSGKDFVWLYDRCDQVSLLDGHVRAFEYFGVVPQRCVYDNLKAAVKRVLYPHRELTSRFQALVSHYLFEPCFTRVGTGHDKGGVESRGKGIRLQHLTPIPQGESLPQLAQGLLEKVEKAYASKRDKQGHALALKFEEEKQLARPLPPHPFDPSRVVTVSISSQSTVQIEGAVYSLPSHWARLEATAYVGVDQIRIACQGEQVIHPKQRSGERYVCYTHYLSELARKPQAVRQVAPELMQELGDPFGRLWTFLEESHGGREAGRVMAKVLQAILEHSLEGVTTAVQQALNANRVDLLALFSEGTESRPQPIPVPEALSGYIIDQAQAADYDVFLQGGGYE